MNGEPVTHGFPGLPGLPELAELVWQLTAGLRREAHRGHERNCGAIAPYGRRDPRGISLRTACREAGCLDLLHDVLLVVQPKLQRRATQPEPPKDLMRYANATVQRVLADMGRGRRVQLGMPAKPTRCDGVTGRVEAALLADAADDVARTWLSTLFRLVRAYPCRPSPAGRGWPLDAWAAEKSSHDGRSRIGGTREARAEIESDIGHVLAVVDQVAGPAWRYRNITEPLRRGSGATSLDELTESAAAHPVSETLEDEVMVALFEGCYRALRARGASQVDAFRDASTEVFGKKPEAPVRRILALAEELDPPSVA